jgi:hypothetical protein
VKILDSLAGTFGASALLSFCLFTIGPSRPLLVKEEGIFDLLAEERNIKLWWLSSAA